MSQKILVIRLGSLGDIVLTSATVANLKINFPDSSITYLCKERFRSVVDLIHGVDEVLTIPDGISAPGFFRLLLELDSHNFDAIIDLHGNLRSWAARKMISANTVAVYPKRRFERLISVKGKVIPKLYPHTIDLYNDTIEQLGGRVHCRRPLLKTTHAELSPEAAAFAARNPAFVVFAPGAAHPNKQWPVERFEQVAVTLNRKHGLGIVWAIAGQDVDKTSFGEHIDAGSFIDLADEPVGSLTKLMEQSALTIANDSGIAHLSSGVGTPVLAIFGPTHPALGFSPRGLNDRVIEVDEFCRPCSLHGRKPCYRDQRYCFDRISVDMVMGHASELLAENTREAKAVFVDRDGTMIVDKNFLSNPDEIEFEQGAIAALRRLTGAGYKIVIISNQSGVARGYFDTDTVDLVNARLLEMLASEHVEIDALYYCPHYPRGSVSEFAVSCDCRKPSPGMVEEAAYQLAIDLRKSFVIGDKVDDVNLAEVVGAGAIMVRTGYGSKQQDILLQNPFYADVKIADNLGDAADLIVNGYDKC